MRKFIGAVSCGFVVVVSISASSAMNWEGHDDWLDSQSHGTTLREHLPKPLIRKYSSCEDMKARLNDNPYEQRPLPGKNCFDSEQVDSEGEPDLRPEK